MSDKQPLSRRELRELETRRGRSRNVPSIPAAPNQAGGAQSIAAPIKKRTIVVRRKPAKRTGTSPVLSVGALLFAALLFVGMSVPANAFITTTAPETSATPLAAQSLAVSDSAVLADATRAGFTVTSYAELLRARYGNRSYSYTVGSGAVQWPFPYAVPISDGFGERIAPCRGCSSFHKGTDFTPGGGSAIYAVASGVVSYTEVSDWGFGNHVIIDHVINGVKVQSMYAHMQMNSSPLNVGDTVKVGDFVGLVGETGVAFGAHLHFEIHVRGVQVDPFEWLKKNAAA